MSSRLTVFLDDGGVMNDNARRGEQWRWHVAEFFVPRLGGELAAWSEANRIIAHKLFDLDCWEERLRQAGGDYQVFDRGYQIDWLGQMCDLVGVPRLPDDEAVPLAHEATICVCRRVRAAFPGAVEAIRELHRRDYPLHTASGESSYDLTGYLEGMEVHDCFGRLYGPDLINTFKNCPAYYECLLADAGVSPDRALIVDDSPKAIAWAASVGARTVLVGQTACPEAHLIIGSLAELPHRIAEVEWNG